MPLTLSKVLTKEVPLDVEWEGETINLHYRIGQYTVKYMETTDSDQSYKATQFVADLVSRWDLMDDSGQVVKNSTPENPLPVPVDVKYFEKLPISLMQTIVGAIMKDQHSPNRKKQTP